MSGLIKKCFDKAHLEIRDRVKRAAQLEGMGCTANLLIINKQRFTLGHVGDSRTYRLRNNVLEQLTTDHSFVQQQIEMGLLTPDQALTHKMRSVILQAVGVSDSLEIDIIEGDVQPEDMFMLCTDGLYTMLSENQIRQILVSEMSVDQKVSLLINLANGAGGKDNITVVLAAVTAP
jgi:serine/threonine protein phosphatase PrpC